METNSIMGTPNYETDVVRSSECTATQSFTNNTDYDIQDGAVICDGKPIEIVEAQGFHFDSEDMVDGTFIKRNEYLKDTKEWDIIKQELSKLDRIKEIIVDYSEDKYELEETVLQDIMKVMDEEK